LDGRVGDLDQAKEEAKQMMSTDYTDEKNKDWK